jgi:cell division septation protein DedD
MDRRVKERLVGASILVVLIVLIVPELLSGPASSPVTPAAPRLPASAPEPVRNVTVDFATSKPAREPAADVAAAGAPPAAAPGETATRGELESADGQSAAPPAAPPAAPAALPEPRPSVPLETAAPPPTSSATGAKPASAGHAWVVQLGSFASRGNADNLARQVKAQGFAVLVSPSGSASSVRYRVRTGALADRNAASQTVAKLKSLGFAASIVPPGR